MELIAIENADDLMVLKELWDYEVDDNSIIKQLGNRLYIELSYCAFMSNLTISQMLEEHLAIDGNILAVGTLDYVRDICNHNGLNADIILSSTLKYKNNKDVYLLKLKS